MRRSETAWYLKLAEILLLDGKYKESCRLVISVLLFRAA
jgi:hypothetical protein